MANHKRDVEIVQGLLNRHIVPPVGLPKVDGYAGPATINAILAFQRRIGIVNCDGRVDPGRRTQRSHDPGRYNSRYGHKPIHSSYCLGRFFHPAAVTDSSRLSIPTAFSIKLSCLSFVNIHANTSTLFVSGIFVLSIDCKRSDSGRTCCSRSVLTCCSEPLRQTIRKIYNISSGSCRASQRFKLFPKGLRRK